jgi:hypothetical protein
MAAKSAPSFILITSLSVADLFEVKLMSEEQ